MFSWKTHMAALGAGALLGIGGVSALDADKLKAEETKTEEARSKLNSCLSKNRELRDENKTLREIRSAASVKISALRDENERMSKWMDWMLEQERRLGEENTVMEACFEESLKPEQVDALPEGVKLTDEGRKKMADLIKNGCKVDSIIDGRIRFTQAIQCKYNDVQLEEDPGRDYINREAFQKGLTESEEDLLDAFEKRKYRDVVDKVTAEELREGVEKRLENFKLSEDAEAAITDFIEAMAEYKQNPESFEAKCRLLDAYTTLEHISGLGDFLEGQVAISLLLQAIDDGGLRITREEVDLCRAAK